MTATILSPTFSTPTNQKGITNVSARASSGIGGQVQEFIWSWQDTDVTIVYETLGQGTPILLVPNLSMVSTRSEMADLAQYLSRRFQVITFDWPGFGDSDRPALDYTAKLYRQFLQDLVQQLGGRSLPVIAPGHAASYVMQLLQACPELWTKVVAISPTWKSPFTSAGLRYLLGGVVRRLVRTPVVGSLFYGLNSTTGFLRVRHARKVYVKDDTFNSTFLEQKRQTTQKVGARHAAIALVTGGLDPVCNSGEFYGLFKQPSTDILLIRGEDVPQEECRELETIETVSGLQTKILPGSLALHEEYPAELAKAIMPFLSPPPSILNVAASSNTRPWLGVSILGILVATASLVAWALNVA